MVCWREPWISFQCLTSCLSISSSPVILLGSYGKDGKVLAMVWWGRVAVQNLYWVSHVAVALMGLLDQTCAFYGGILGIMQHE